MRNKALGLADYIVDQKFDIVGLTETWLRQDGADQLTTTSVSPSGYELVSYPRKTGKRGRVTLLTRGSMHTKPVVKAFSPSTFEYIERVVKIDALSVCIIIIPRPPSNAKNGFTFNGFMQEISSLLELKMSASEKLLIAGDFNTHIDDTSSSNTTRFMDMLDALGIQ